MRKLTQLAVFSALLATGVSCASAGPASSTAATSKVNQTLISAEEIAATPNLRDAYEVVQRLRPTWLTKMSTQGVSMSGTNIATGQGGFVSGGVIVYLDDARMGGLSALKDIPLGLISNIQYMDAATATALLPGLTSYVIAGAIVVHARNR